jgi:predicted nucleic acid-binding protein
VKFLLDTNVLSELLKGRPDPAVIDWMRMHQSTCAMSSLTLAEMAAGVEKLPQGKRRNALTKEVSFLQEDFADSILAVDEMVAWEWARYTTEAQKAGFNPTLIDSLIAATAKANGLMVVTRNTADFPLMEVINPFTAT